MKKKGGPATVNDTQTLSKRRLPPAPSLFLALALTFFMTFCAFPEVTLYRYMVILVFVLLLFIAVRSRLVTILSILPCALAFLNAELSPAFVLLLCAIAIIGYGGFAITSIHPALVAAAPVASCLLAFAITGDPVRALDTLVFVPMALVAALALRLKFSRTGAIAAVTATLLTVTAGLLFLLLPEGVSLSAESISEFVARVREIMSEALLELSSLDDRFAPFGENAEEISETLVNTTLRLLPSLVIVSAEILAYLACLIAITMRTSQFPEEKLPAECRVFRMSALSAILFLISFALSLFPLGKNDTIGILLITALNLFVILLPGLAVCGAIRLLVAFRQKHMLPPILLILLCLWFASVLPTILAFLDAFTILRTEKFLNKNRENKH
jgi:hypothetical protein